MTDEAGGKRIAARYLFAVVMTVFAVALQWLLKPVVSIAVFIILYPAVFITAWAAGFGPSLVAIGLSSLSALSVFAYPRELEPDDFARVGIFMVGATLVSWIVARGREAERAVRNGLERERQAREALRKNADERSILLQREKEARTQAEKAVQLRDEFIAIASHELKTPMTPLKLQSQLILRTLNLKKPIEEEKLRTFLNLVDRQVDKLIKLVDDMLDISRISTGQLSMKMADFNFSELVRNVTARMAQQYPSESLISVETEEEILCQGDSSRIEQLLINLLSNAFKYGEGKPIQVKLVKAGKDQAQLSVRDQGIGISHEDRQRIFERFERAVSASHISGLGVGLYLANQIARAHHGALRVESERGKGSVFILELPLRQTS